jgi:hypothetical protein
MSFAAFIILASTSVEAKKTMTWQTTVTKENTIYYPAISFRLPPPDQNAAYKILNATCHVNTTKEIINYIQCPEYSKEFCVLFESNKTAASSDNLPSDSDQINKDHLVCIIEVEDSQSPPNLGPVLSLQLNHQPVRLIDPREPLIHLRKSTISSRFINGDYWYSDVSYFQPIQSTPLHGNIWSFKIIFNIVTFDVFHYEEMEYTDEVGSFNGWMAAGAIGGFAYFMYILHTIVMFLLGFFLTNNSKFLTGQDSYNRI